MNVTAKIDLTYHGHKYKTGHQFDALADDAQDMILWGWIDGTPPAPIRLSGQGYYAVASTRTVTGSDLWITVDGHPVDTPPGYEDYVHSLTSWQLLDGAGNVVDGCTVDYSWQNGMEPAYDGFTGKWIGYMPGFLHLILPERDLAFGAYRFRFLMECIPVGQQSGAAQTVDVPVFIAQHQTPLGYNNTHPIPGRDRWEQEMVAVADKWAPQILDPDNALGENNWYYDIASTYLEINRYLKTDRYFEVAMASAKRYADYLIECNGGAAPWCVFPRGLRQMYQSTQDRSWVDVLASLRNSGWVRTAGSPDPMLMRETAYALDYWREMTWVGGGDEVMLERAVSYSLTQLNKLFIQEWGRADGMICEPFFAGLMMQALIDYYEIMPDERIPPAIATTCQWIWEIAVDGATGYVKYDAFKPTTDWFTGLNGLMCNAWGFLYAVSGDDIWRQQGDILFQHMWDDHAYDWSPKQFAQCFRRTIDYVTRWRA
jgi:hypothetical protein